MNLENTKAQMRKGVLEYCILSILANNDAYASDIINELKEARMIVVEGTMYPLLTRQKNAGLLSYRWEESQQGPPRKYYTLTEKGKAFLEELDKSWQDLITAVSSINQTRSQPES
ncbi:MAG: PadR family transcriptional regulator [bacterium]